MLYPIFSNEEAINWERSVLKTERDEEIALRKAGTLIGEKILEDFQEIRLFPEDAKLLVLAGSGHNAGDAIIAAGAILKENPGANLCIILIKPLKKTKPLLQKVVREILDQFHQRIEIKVWSSTLANHLKGNPWTVVLDGLLGLSFKLPLRDDYRDLIEIFNNEIYPQCELVAAVDFPSGYNEGESELFIKSDFIYMAGIPKAILINDFKLRHCARLRFIDLRFFDAVTIESKRWWIDEGYFRKQKKLRPADSEKRQFGKVHLIAGSNKMPGALFMAGQAALMSGAGLVTCHTPKAVAYAGSSYLPEAMWNHISLQDVDVDKNQKIESLFPDLEGADSILLGPGLVSNESTLTAITEIVARSIAPVVLDASALYLGVFESRALSNEVLKPLILTPHFGEMKRLLEMDDDNITPELLLDFCRKYKVIVLLKGAISHLCDGDKIASFSAGGPVLARGGSGDILAGMVATLLAQTPNDPFGAVANALTWQGGAARLLARSKGQHAVRSTQFLDYLSPALRGE